MSIRQNGKTISGSNKYLPDLFDYKTTDYLLKNPSWLRADTFSWHNGDIYIPAYNQLVREANNFTDIVSETVNGITISFTLNENGHKIVNGQDSENVAKVNEIYEQTGCSWYYILDIVNKRFKLPRELTRDRDAKLIRSEDNGTTWYRLYDDGWVEQGGFCNATQYNNTTVNVTFPITMADTNYTAIANPNTPNHQETWAISARCAVKTTTNMCVHGSNNANSAYTGVCVWEVKGYSAQTYKSPKTRYLYFYVGPFTQLDIINDPDVIEILNHKADIDLENILSNIDYVVDSQLPTAENNYTWYRKYKSGWVEQGGQSTSDGQTITFPIPMANAEYFVTGMAKEVDTGAISSVSYNNKTATSITFYGKRVNASGFASGAHPVYWEVKGISA